MFTGALSPIVPQFSTPSLLPWKGEQPTWISIFQAGHGWTSNGSGVSVYNANDTSDFVLGGTLSAAGQCASMITAGNGSAAQIRKTAIAGLGDFTNRSFVVVMKASDIVNMNTMDFYAGSGGFTAFYRFRMQTTGSATIYYMNAGEWVTFILNWQDLTQTTGVPAKNALTDFQVSVVDKNGIGIKYLLNGVGYVPAPTTVYPNGVMSVVFDDGFATQFTNARGVMDANGQEGTAFLITDLIDNNPNYMTTPQLQQLYYKNGWKFGLHSFTLADHNTRFDNLTAQQLSINLVNEQKWMKSIGIGPGIDVAYPGGNFNQSVIQTVSQFCRSGRTILDVTHETLPTGDPFRLRCHTTINTDSTASLQTLIDNAYASSGYLILLFHDIPVTATVSTQYSLANFTTVMNYASTKGIPVKNMDDVLSRYPF